MAFQRLGDQNQTLYEDTDVAVQDYWSAGAHTIPLTTSRRFGPEIARFASRLTARSSQLIDGRPGIPERRILLLFDKASIGNVLSAYAKEIRLHWLDGLVSTRTIWAVASRHSLYRTRGKWPKSLVDYHPTYRAETGAKAADTLCRMMQKAGHLPAPGNPNKMDMWQSRFLFWRWDVRRHFGERRSDGDGCRRTDLCATT